MPTSALMTIAQPLRHSLEQSHRSRNIFRVDTAQLSSYERLDDMTRINSQRRVIQVGGLTAPSGAVKFHGTLSCVCLCTVCPGGLCHRVDSRGSLADPIAHAAAVIRLAAACCHARSMAVARRAARPARGGGHPCDAKAAAARATVSLRGSTLAATRPAPGAGCKFCKTLF
eukprot:SAG31_NODE_2208_length_6187_cov_5.255749_1_plen_171_part_00